MISDMSLEDALHNVDTQRRILNMGADALHILGTTADREICLVGSKEVPEPKKLQVGGNAVARAIAREKTPDIPTQEPDIILNRVAGFLQSVASTNIDDISRTWCVLSIFLLLPRARAHAKACSSVRVAAYFDGNGTTIKPFDDRLSTKLCGTNCTQAMTPLEIVVSEWQLLALILGQHRV
jgi:hypothetical protein